MQSCYHCSESKMYLETGFWHSHRSTEYVYIVCETCLAANVLYPLAQQCHRIHFDTVLYIDAPPCSDIGLYRDASRSSPPAAASSEELLLTVPAQMRFFTPQAAQSCGLHA